MKTVLIVDDSNQIRERLVTLLSESAHIRIIAQAANGLEAMAAFQRLKPDTVILDIHLPGNNGIEILKAIKARSAHTKVIMLTNHDDVQYRQQCRRLGADHFLNKALEFEKLVDVIMAGNSF